MRSSWVIGTIIILTMVSFLLWTLIFSRSIAVGAWTHGLWDNTTKTLHTEKLKQFEETVSKKMSIAHIYRGWGELDTDATINALHELDHSGWMPMLSANPYYFDQCPASSLPLYESIAKGACDAYIERVAARLQQFDKPFYLRFAWEMNIASNEWSVPYTKSKSADFVNAWRRIHDIIAKKNTKIIWVFCPNVLNGSNTVPFKDLYPGDTYVDWTCLDGYNWGNTQSWSHWQSFSEIYHDSYNQLIQIAPEKPVMIGEVNSATSGGNKAQWLEDMFIYQIPFRFTKVKAVILYNENREQIDGVDWTLDHDEASVKALQKVLNLRYYR